jgi:hypothetical protein
MCCKKSRFFALLGMQNLEILPPKLFFLQEKTKSFSVGVKVFLDLKFDIISVSPRADLGNINS